MSDSIRVIRKVIVKSVVTEKLKDILSKEARGQMDLVEVDFGRFQEHASTHHRSSYKILLFSIIDICH